MFGFVCYFLGFSYSVLGAPPRLSAIGLGFNAAEANCGCTFEECLLVISCCVSICHYMFQ